MAKDRSPMSKALNALQRLNCTEMTPERYEAYINEIGSLSSDRGIGILMVTTVEDALQSAIKSRLAIADKQRKDFFGPNSLLGSFANKINIGNALEIFGESTRQNLKLLKSIRNLFAHSKIAVDFKTKEIIGACNSLELPLPPVNPDGTRPKWSSQIDRLKGRPRFQTVCSGYAYTFSAYALLAKESQNFSSDQPDERYERELPRPLLKYARQASLVDQPTLPGLGLQYCCSSCA